MTLLLIIVITAVVALLISNVQAKAEKSGELAFPSSESTRFSFAERAYGGLPTVGGVLGALVGGIVGFLLRPAAPIVGQLPFATVITRGTDYRGIDQFLISYAETSFNYLLVGLIIGGVGGAAAAYVISRNNSDSDVAHARAKQTRSPQTVELGLSPQQVEEVLGQPHKKINLGVKVIYVYNDIKITFIDGKVEDVT